MSELYFLTRNKQAPTQSHVPQIWILPITVLIGLIRACTGVTALYETKVFVWAEDKYFYPLDVLPDFLVLGVLCWPKLLARQVPF